MSEGEFMLTGEHVRHGQDNPTDAERYTCRDFEQPCAYGATGRRLQAGLAKGQSLQSGQQDIGCGREPQPELVGPDGVGRGPV
ncbi:hypothetical protein S101468_02786 [Acetobacter pasteurianus subsp. pasteurianus]|uniref:Uncharacterized protein n=2 Tax=Acetobacter pasteurianus subsp. pasteurianus TaxID=481145 RepID=A0AAC9SQR0_ACEPA|nr:hypothetical protein S101468_02786 [Acetobacter pasteurianus subsp. pasteurianus]